MTVVYKTKDNLWQIREQNDSLWQDVFGKDIKIYNICKYILSLSEWNIKNSEARLADYVIIESKEKIEDAFKWLKENKIITLDEMRKQISLRS